MTKTLNKILLWLSIIGCVLVVLAALTGVLVLYVNAVVAAQIETTKPLVVQQIESDIGIMRNDINHLVGDVADNKRISEDTNRIFRKYLEEQSRQ